VTALSIAVLNGAAAGAGIIYAREFGRGSRTDGLLLAFNVYLVLVLTANALRVVVLPELTRAAAQRRLAEELGGYVAALAAIAACALALAVVVAVLLGTLVSGETARLFARALPWFVLAGGLQLLAALAVSALAALDNYRVAALGFSLGGLGGLGLFGLLVAAGAGQLGLAWGLVANAAIALTVPTVALLARGLRPRLGQLELRRRLSTLARGAALPISLQALYAIAGPFALRLGAGEATTFTYAYAFAAFLVAVSATSLSFISSAPLTRRGMTGDDAARHVVATSWLSLSALAAAVGIFALVGGRIVGAVLGGAYGGHVGRELGQAVVYLGPWMLVSVALTVTFPLLFVLERPAVLVPLAVALPPLQALVTWGLSDWLGLRGIALSLGLTTLVALAVLMVGLSPRTLMLAAAGLARQAAVLVGLAALSFGVVAAIVGGAPAAAIGLAVYLVLLPLAWPLGLREAWAYVRALH